MRDDVRQRRLAEAGRAEDEHVVQRFAAPRRRFDAYTHLAMHGGLADVLGQPFRPNAVVQAVFLGAG